MVEFSEFPGQKSRHTRMEFHCKEAAMTVIHVDGIHCQSCVSRITRAMQAEGFTFTVSLEDKTVTLPDSTRLTAALEVLEDLGFRGRV